jgi:hypothetical protein
MLSPPRQQPLVQKQLGGGDGLSRLDTYTSLLSEFVLPKVFGQITEAGFASIRLADVDVQTQTTDLAPRGCL